MNSSAKSFSYKEYHIKSSLKQIQQWCSEAGLGDDTIEKSKENYLLFSEKKDQTIVYRGSTRLSIIAGCILYTMHDNKYVLFENIFPDIRKKIILVTKMTTSLLKRGYKIFCDAVCVDDIDSEQFESDMVENNIRHHCQILGISEININLAIEIAKNCHRLRILVDYHPRVSAGGIVMTMIDYQKLDVERKLVAEIFMISEVTITKIYNKICPYIDALVDDDATDYLIKKFNLSD